MRKCDQLSPYLLPEVRGQQGFRSALNDCTGASSVLNVQGESGLKNKFIILQILPF